MSSECFIKSILYLTQFLRASDFTFNITSLDFLLTFSCPAFYVLHFHRPLINTKSKAYRPSISSHVMFATLPDPANRAADRKA